ncbi:hypothetical protein OpiT1DRAFT_05422 [Opitutaceae bacterium TAV1]|nr:hypothetical protein OpiT1DRAFT_05422 [Opitutaceae bacterium TAV1]
MADIFPLAHIEQYNSSVQHLAAIQKYAFEGKGIRIESNVGKVQWLNQIGDRTMRRITDRNGDITFAESKFGQRALRCFPYGDAAIYDDFDRARAAIEPNGPTAISQAHAVNKTKNAIIIDAALGTSYERFDEESMGDAVELGADRKVAVDFEAPGTNTGLTLAKLIKIKSLISQDDVADASQKYFVYSQGMLDQLLLNVQEVKSTDYAEIKALQEGRISYFLGMHWIKSSQLPVANGVRSCFAYVDQAIAFANQKNGGIKTKAWEMDNKWGSTGIKTTIDTGATRVREDWVSVGYCAE